MELLSYAATWLRGGGQCNPCNTLPHRLGAVGSGTPAKLCGPPRRGDGQSCPGGGGCLKGGTLAMQCHTASGQRAVQLLQCTATMPGAVGSGNPVRSCHTTQGHWVVELLQCAPAAHLLGGRGVLPRRRSLPKNGTLATHRLTAWGQWAVELPSCTATLLRGSGQCNSCNTQPHCLGGMGS